MIKQKIIICTIAVIGSMMLFSFRPAGTVTREKTFALQPGDTASFVPDRAKGWDIISSYMVQATPDSVSIELLLVFSQEVNTAAGINQQFIGTITNKNFIPKREQEIVYYLLPDDSWRIIVKTNGKCYLSQNKNSDTAYSRPIEEINAMPINIMFKNN
jgi:hypothetical protein